MNARALCSSLGLLVAVTAPVFGQALARGGPAARQGTWQDTTYIDAIIRLDIENGPADVLPALTYNAKLMLPVRQFFALAEIRMAGFALRDSAVAVLEPGSVRLEFRPGRKLIRLGADSIRYDSLDVVWWENDLFVTSALLDRLLGVSTSVEWNSLSATVGRSAGLPAVLRQRREYRRQLMGIRRPEPDVLDLALRNRPLDGAVGSWNITALRRGPTEQLTLDLGIGAQLLGGSAELRPLFYAADNNSDAQLRWSWWKAWPQSKSGVRQLRIGDVQTGGVRSRLMTGVSVTNAPFLRSSEFDIEHLVTNVPAGWEAELYEGGRLLAYSEPEAVGAFRVPLQLGYGQNPYELVLYGPGGQTVRRTRTIRVPFSRLPNGHLEYAVSAGHCRYDPCDALASADARYGLSSRVTLQGGWDAFFDHARGNQYRPYAVVSGAVLPSLALTGEAVANDHLRGTVNFEPTMDLRATAGYTRFVPSGARLSGGFAEATRSEASLFWRPAWNHGATIRFEVRAKLPKGPGSWPAHWLMPSEGTGGWPADGEIDVMESFGGNVNKVAFTLHWADQGQHQQGGAGCALNLGRDFGDDFHVFAVEWDPDEIRWYVDDYRVKTVQAKDKNNHKSRYQIPKHPFYWILNTSISTMGMSGGSLDPARFPVGKHFIDWVRVYRRR